MIVALLLAADDDPTRRTTKAAIDLFRAWVPKAMPSVQFVAGTYLGLNRDMPDVELFIGVAKRF